MAGSKDPRLPGDLDPDLDYRQLFQRFCDSSTIHGTYFWGQENKATAAKLVWIVIVFAGVSTSAIIINNSFSAWKLNPVITSVAQNAIEQVPFPSVTICPLGNTG